MLTNKIFGISVYLESFDKEFVLKFPKGTHVFMTLHMREELEDPNYKQKVEEIINFLNENGYKTVCDLSPRGLKTLGFETPQEIASEYNITYSRLDYGWEKEMEEISKEVDVVINASTISELNSLIPGEIYMHNFYPRKDSGLSDDDYKNLNNEIHGAGGRIWTWIPGNEKLRSPVFEQMVVTESQRGQDVFGSFLKEWRNDKIEAVFIADGAVDDITLAKILKYIDTGVIEIKAEVPEIWYNKELRLRSDSGANVHRFTSTRSNQKDGTGRIEPENNVQRPKGTITMDNHKYNRYEGEIQIVKNDLPADERVNVIGKMDPLYADVIKPFDTIVFIK